MSEGMLSGAWPGRPGMTIPVAGGSPGKFRPGMPYVGCTAAGTGGSWPGLIHSPAAARW